MVLKSVKSVKILLNENLTEFKTSRIVEKQFEHKKIFCVKNSFDIRVTF